ncbi:response regulator [Cellulophaga baltica]|uniref:response regulator n=1 Tax=Cellulophaga TaxID=104264 RepID=UPI001C067258|nr:MULTISPECIES: response regulator [Cellulophaga]MBU2995680.1 response regulator [Cellulophaga baltica]MDO6767074.1 response regulator [Cellulophaga sp. 1_MG-2023]
MNKIERACVIDDDPICVFGIKKILKKVGFCNEIIVFKNGFEAINGLKDLLKQNKPLPQIIFLDLNMPIMDGWDFLEDFIKIPNANRTYVAIYIISSSLDPRDLEKVKEYSSVTNYLIKPITSEKIDTVIGEYLN